MITGAWVPGSLSEVGWLLATLDNGGAAVVTRDFLICDLTVAVAINHEVGAGGCVVTLAKTKHLDSIGMDHLAQGSQTI